MSFPRILSAPIVVLALTAGLLFAPTSGVAASKAIGSSSNLVINGGFESGLKGWRTNGRAQKLRKAKSARSGSAAARLTRKKGRGVLVLNDKRNSTTTSNAKERFRLTAWVRTNKPNVNGQLRIRAVKGGKVQKLSKSFSLRNKRWTKVELEGRVRRAGASLDVNVVAWKVRPGVRVLVDDVRLVRVTERKDRTPVADVPSVGDPKKAPAAGRLSNGCTYSSRGIPACGAYVGASHAGNTDPSAWESDLGRQLGVRRTFFQKNNVDGAVKHAKMDASRNRVSWISFKVKASEWADIASGKEDAWAREAAAKLAQVPGPVWVAVHHEPENDGGDIKQWTKMQERLAPIFRSAGDNIAYSIILMGYHQFYGDARFSLNSMWPNTKIDIAGFDLYDNYGLVKNGGLVTSHRKFRENYFEKIRAWAKPRGIAWGLAETGFTKASVDNTPKIMSKVYADLVDTGGIAFAYFDSTLNSVADWSLSDARRKQAFATIHRESPVLQ